MAKRLTEAEVRALTVTVDVPTAGMAWGFGRTMSYDLARAGEFPCEVLPFGTKKIVLKATLMKALGMTDDEPHSEPAPGTATVA